MGSLKEQKDLFIYTYCLQQDVGINSKHAGIGVQRRNTSRSQVQVTREENQESTFILGEEGGVGAGRIRHGIQHHQVRHRLPAKLIPTLTHGKLINTLSTSA